MGTFSCSRGRVRGGERMSAWRKGSGGEPGVDVARHENVSHMGHIFVSGWRIRVENRQTPPTAQMGRLVVCRMSQTQNCVSYGMCFHVWRKGLGQNKLNTKTHSMSGGGVGPVVEENKPDMKTHPIWDAFS